MTTVSAVEKSSIRDKLENGHFRKIKTRMILEALISGSSIRGNHKVQYGYLNGIHVFEFYYRDTRIMDVHILPSGVVLTEDIDAGEFDNTPATIRQRQDIRSATDEVESILHVAKVVV